MAVRSVVPALPDPAPELRGRRRAVRREEQLRRRLEQAVDGGDEALAVLLLHRLGEREPLDVAGRLGLDPRRARELLQPQRRDRPLVAAIDDPACAGRWRLVRGYAAGELEPDGERHRLAREHLASCALCRTRALLLGGLAALEARDAPADEDELEWELDEDQPVVAGHVDDPWFDEPAGTGAGPAVAETLMPDVPDGGATADPWTTSDGATDDEQAVDAPAPIPAAALPVDAQATARGRGVPRPGRRAVAALVGLVVLAGGLAALTGGGEDSSATATTTTAPAGPTAAERAAAEAARREEAARRAAEAREQAAARRRQARRRAARRRAARAAAARREAEAAAAASATTTAPAEPSDPEPATPSPSPAPSSPAPSSPAPEATPTPSRDGGEEFTPLD